MARSGSPTPTGDPSRHTSRAVTAARRRVLSGLAATLAVLAFAGIAGCDFGGFVSEAPTAVCTESGALCQLAKGPLGVCEHAPCPPGTDPPCFQCTPQH